LGQSHDEKLAANILETRVKIDRQAPEELVATKVLFMVQKRRFNIMKDEVAVLNLRNLTTVKLYWIGTSGLPVTSTHSRTCFSNQPQPRVVNDFHVSFAVAPVEGLHGHNIRRVCVIAVQL
jgi:hypothetical protein